MYRRFPFDLSGDLTEDIREARPGFVSCCLVCTARRLSELDGLLGDLAGQSLEKERYEVVVVNDGGGRAVDDIIGRYAHTMHVVSRSLDPQVRVLGRLRNMSLAMARGEYIVLLDDDTRILQRDFLSTVLSIFSKGGPDVLLVRASPLYGLVRQRYDFLDEYSFSNRCCVYRRETLLGVRGFKHCMATYEDVEIEIRLSLKGVTVASTDAACYFHPPLFFDSLRKPLCIGQSIMNLRREYSLPVWILVYLNALRFLPYYFVPTCRKRQWGNISLGVLLGPFKKRLFYY